MAKVPLIATKPLRWPPYSTRHFVAGDMFEASRGEALVLVHKRKAARFADPEYLGEPASPPKVPLPPAPVVVATPASPPPATVTAENPAPAKRHPLDHDGDGKPGGSLPKKEKKSKPKADD